MCAFQDISVRVLVAANLFTFSKTNLFLNSLKFLELNGNIGS